MRLVSFTTTVLLAALVTATGTRSAILKSGAPYCPPRPATSQQQKAIFNEFINKLYVDRNGTRALLDHMPEDYIQHNPFAHSGRGNGIDALSFVSPDTVEFTIARLGIDGDIAFIHSGLVRVNRSQPTAAADFFRFEGSCLVEH